MPSYATSASGRTQVQTAIMSKDGEAKEESQPSARSLPDNAGGSQAIGLTKLIAAMIELKTSPEAQF